MRRPTSIEIRATPVGRSCVLLQLEDGYALLLPDDAEHVADLLVHYAAEARETG